MRGKLTGRRHARSRWWGAAVAVTALTVAAVVPGGVRSAAALDRADALGGPRGDPVSGPVDRLRAQMSLVRAATVLNDAVSRAPGGGYAGIGLTGDRITLWWKGALPAEVRAAVGDAGRIAPVHVSGAAYSRAELAAAGRRVRAALGTGASAPRTRVLRSADGSGLRVSVDDTWSGAVRVPDVGVPVSVVREPWQVPRSRDDDTPPWRGGIVMNGACTAGFGVRDGAGNRYLLTAGHCGDIGSAWYDGQGEPIGTMTAEHEQHDIALISTASAGDSIYTGGISDERQSVVSGWTPVFPGMLLCQGGRSMANVTGGPRCNIEVLFLYPDNPEDRDLVEARQIDGKEVAYSGDSGGPVYAAGPNGTVLAAGIVNRSLGPNLGFQDFTTVAADFGVEPVTGTVGPCRVDYQVTGAWTGGFNANVTITNTGAPTTGGWRLDFAFTTPGHQEIADVWQATRTQVGEQVTLRNVANNAVIPTGGAVTLGFRATGDRAVPGLFAVNGAYCT